METKKTLLGYEKMELIGAKTISCCEEITLFAIWGCEDAPTTLQLMRTLNEQFKKHWKLPAVETFLDRLIKKGYITYISAKKTRYFVPLISKEEYGKWLLEGTIQRYYSIGAGSVGQDVHKMCRNIDIGCFLLCI